METASVISASVKVGPGDHRCRFWCKIIRSGTELPAPSSVTGAANLPGPYLKNGEEEIFPGDVMIEGEENHHQKARGWTYRISFINPNTHELVKNVTPTAAHKAAIKSAGVLPIEMLAGSGDIAACVRIGHAVRKNFWN